MTDKGNYPNEVDEKVQKLLIKMKKKESPFLVNVKPEKNAKINECVDNVIKKIESDGGLQIFGWQIMQSKNITEAGFHSIWQSPDGVYLDITPREIYVNSVLFIKDDIKYIGCQIDNIRVNTSVNFLVDDIITISELLFILQNKGERAFEKKVTLKDKDFFLYNSLIETYKIIEEMIKVGYNNKNYCGCRSGKKYKYCHGEKLQHIKDEIQTL
jgi:hypothetical protein